MNLKTYNGNVDAAEFVKVINDLRLSTKKDSWYSLTGIINGKEYRLRAYQTWIQTFKIDGIEYGFSMDLSVKEYKTELLSVFNSAFKGNE